MKKINITTREVTNEALPKFLEGLKQESLNDLSWTDSELGVQDYGFWQEQDVTVYDNTKVLDNTETYELDEDNFIVKVTKGQRDKTAEELEAEFKASVPQVITMRQARLVLLNANLLDTVETAIANGTDETLKIEWEYATEVRRDWESLMATATALGMTEIDLDNLFIEGAKL